MVEFDDGALIKLFPCGGQGRIEARNSGKSVIEMNHKIPFLVAWPKREEGIAGVAKSAHSGLHCVGSQFVQTGAGKFHTFPAIREKCGVHFAAV
jgi:hypothetical protein